MSSGAQRPEAAARLFHRGRRGPLVCQAALDTPRVLPPLPRVLPLLGLLTNSVHVRAAGGAAHPGDQEV